MSDRRPIFYGWWVVAGLFIIGMFGPLGRYCVTAFLPFVTVEMGWSRASIGLGQSITLWMYAFFVLLSGSMVDRIGSRKTFFIGGIVTLIGWMLLSTINTHWQFYLYYGVLMALAVAITHAVPLQSTSRKWFTKRAGLVAGISATAFAVGTSVFMPVMTGMADLYGWRATSLICGISFGTIIMLVAFFVIRDTPESMGLYPDGEKKALSSGCDSPAIRISGASFTVKEAVKTPQLWLLFIAYSMIAIPLQGTFASIIVWGVDLGSTKATAGLFMTAIAIPSIVGKIGGGWLGDKYGKKRFLFIAPILGMLVMLYGWQTVHTQQSLTVFAIFMGITYGIPFALFTPYLGDLFGRAYVGSLFGILTLGHGLIGGCGPVIWGKIYEISGNYNTACLTSAICYAIAAIAIFLIQPLKIE